MTAVSFFYALLFYFAFAIFALGLSWKIFSYARTPQRLRIPTTPAPTTFAGVIWRMAKEIFVFESLFKADKWLWLFAWIFHAALLLVLLHHLSVFGLSLGWFAAVTRHGGTLLLIGLAGLWIRRVAIDRMRYISAPSDHLMLALFTALVGTGLGMYYLAYPDILALRLFFNGLLSLSVKPLPMQPLLLMHLALFAILLIIFPMSKLLHAPGVFFSPTRNQVDRSRR